MMKIFEADGMALEAVAPMEGARSSDMLRREVRGDPSQNECQHYEMKRKQKQTCPRPAFTPSLIR